jgi:hypothetical protein
MVIQVLLRLDDLDNTTSNKKETVHRALISRTNSSEKL